MIIANPIYDTVFKRMMENERVAKFFIGTLLNQHIEHIEVRPQELTQTLNLAPTGLAIFRLDFVATIKTAEGEYKKILIEVQKAKGETDLMRFRGYLAEQYKRKDKVGTKLMILPITTIYILGFNLPELSSACEKVGRYYWDLIEDRATEDRSEFLEKLSHDCYVVQVNRITNRYQTRLDQLLSVFQQDNFVGDTRTIKRFQHPAHDEDLKIMTNILHYAGTNPEERRQIEMEQEAWRTYEEHMESAVREKQEKLEETQKKLAEKESVIAEKESVIAEKESVIAVKDKELGETKQELAETKKEKEAREKAYLELVRELEELKRQNNSGGN